MAQKASPKAQKLNSKAQKSSPRAQKESQETPKAQKAGPKPQKTNKDNYSEDKLFLEEQVALFRTSFNVPKSASIPEAALQKAVASINQMVAQQCDIAFGPDSQKEIFQELREEYLPERASTKKRKRADSSLYQKKLATVIALRESVQQAKDRHEQFERLVHLTRKFDKTLLKTITAEKVQREIDEIAQIASRISTRVEDPTIQNQIKKRRTEINASQLPTESDRVHQMVLDHFRQVYSSDRAPQTIEILSEDE